MCEQRGTVCLLLLAELHIGACAVIINTHIWMDLERNPIKTLMGSSNISEDWLRAVSDLVHISELHLQFIVFSLNLSSTFLAPFQCTGVCFVCLFADNVLHRWILTYMAVLDKHTGVLRLCQPQHTWWSYVLCGIAGILSAQLLASCKISYSILANSLLLKRHSPYLRWHYRQIYSQQQ